MPVAPTSTEYFCFASFTVAATTYYIGTQDELRSGNWYAGVIQTAPQLGMSFGDELALVQATNIDLTIADGASGTYRALASGTNLTGIVITVTLVMRQNWSDGTSTEQTYGQLLTIIGVSLQPQQIVLHLQDVEEQKLMALYPPNTWQSTDWPELSSDDAGKPICEPVGTALKLPCVLLRSDSTNSEYWYGVCTGTPKLFAISSINTSTKTITLAAAPLYALAAGQMLIITGSSAADGRYTVASASGTSITTNEAIPASTGGSVRLMPQALTVYRNKRVVGASEYSVQNVYAPGSLPIFNFPGGSLGNFTFQHTGTGSHSVSQDNCYITCINTSNWDGLTYTFNHVGEAKIISGMYVLVVEMNSGGDARLVCNWSSLGTSVFSVPAGKRTAFFMKSPDNSIQPSEYFYLTAKNYSGTCSIQNVAIYPFPLTILKFTKPQIDFNGSNYVIEADCAGVESQNCSTEISRLLALAGATADLTTFTAAAAAGFSQLVDCDYGRSGQRRLDAIIDDLLPVARAGLSRNAAGAYTIWQDVSGAAMLTYDESLGDPVNVTKFESVANPLSVGVTYAPSSADASQMQVTMTRPVTGGILGAEQPREVRYLRDATTADQLLCYRALRRQYNRKATVALYGTQVNIGDKIALSSPRNWPGQITFSVWEVQRVASGNQLTLQEYNAGVYTYTAGTLPPNAPTGYQPDYSFTPPLAPSALAVMATATAIANDGTTTARATIQATPPTANWNAIWFAAIHNVTGEIALAQGASIGGGNYGVTLGPLRPGEVYRLQCYAVNSNNVQGVVQSTFDATAIGGSAGVTTFTTAGNAVLPATVAGCAAVQALGSNIAITWPAVTGTNIAQYVLEKKTGAGSFAQIYAGLATAFTDNSISYSNAYQYRVRAKDTYGNFSAAYATSGTVTPTGNVLGGTGGDIGSTTVATVNRTGVSTASASWSIPTSFVTTTCGFTYSLGTLPVLGALLTGNSSAVGALNSNGGGAANFTICKANQSSAPGISGTASMDYW